MSNLTVRGNTSGTGTIILESPNTNSNRTITLPDAATTLVGTDATQTLTNKTITGATISSSTIQGGSLTLGTAVASTSGTAIDFTGIPSWAKRVTVMFDGVSTNGSSHLIVQLGDSGGFETTGYLGGAGLSAASGVTGLSSSSLGFELEAGSTSAASLRYGSATISNVSANSWVSSSVFGIPNISASVMSGGAKTLSATLDRVRITTVNGTDTFDAGTINIMWEG